MATRGGLGTKRLYTLFDTGAESSNYIYGYFLDELKKHQELKVIKISEHVKFGDQKTVIKIEEAVVLDVKFDDPEDQSRTSHQRGYFHLPSPEAFAVLF